MGAGEEGSCGGADDEPFGVVADAGPKSAVGAFKGGVALGGQGGGLGSLVGEIGQRVGKLSAARLAIFDGVEERLQIVLRNAENCRRGSGALLGRRGVVI